jgi:hypothetical protein
LTGCIQKFNTMQRVVELPPGDPRTSLETAARIGRALIDGGFRVPDRVASGGCPPEAPTDPNVRN